MPNHVIRDLDGRATIGAGRLSIAAHTTPGGAVTVQLRRPQGDETPALDVLPTPSKLIVPRPHGIFEIWLVPGTGGRIADDVVANVVVAVEKRGDIADSVVFEDLKIGALRDYRVGVVHVGESEVSVAARPNRPDTDEDGGVGPTPTDDTSTISLPPRGDASRRVIRNSYDADVLDPSRRRTFRIVVDASTSMTTARMRTRMRDAVESLTGVIAMASDQPTVLLQVVGPTVKEMRVQVRELERLADGVDQLVDSMPATIGLDLALREVWSIDQQGRDYVYILTDAVPADISELRSVTGPAVEWHVVGIGDDPRDHTASELCTFMRGEDPVSFTDADLVRLVPGPR